MFHIPYSPRASRAGFTLIEMLIVVGITALLAGMVLTYTSASRDQVALYVEQAKIAGTISRAKSLALATYASSSPPCGYGVDFNYAGAPQSYSVFSYTDSNCQNFPAGALDQSKVQIVSTDALPANVTMFAGTISPVADILFLAPEPRTWIWQVGGTSTSTQGCVYLKAGGASLLVEINDAGQITFDNATCI